MLDMAFELIGQATSNSLLMFCFCNLIIVMILRGGSKPVSIVDQETAFSTSLGKTTTATDVTPDSHGLKIDVPTFSEKCQESGHCFHDIDDGNDGVDGDKEDEQEQDVEEEEDDDDDDLRNRVEEFIARVNEEWKIEKLRSLNLAF